MRVVYLVNEYESYSDPVTAGVFSTEEKAQKAVEYLEDTYPYHTFSIEKTELDRLEYEPLKKDYFDSK